MSVALAGLLLSWQARNQHESRRAISKHTHIATRAMFTPRRGRVPILPTEKTSRTLFIERHHEEVQREAAREARVDAMWASIMRDSTPPRPTTPPQPSPDTKPATLRSTALGLRAANILFSDRDRRHWSNVCEPRSRRRSDDSIDSWLSDHHLP